MITFPNAKINLGLNILEKRSDGYHNLESYFYPIPWHDSLEILESNTFSFKSYGLEIPGGSTNLCIKAYDLLKEDFDLPPVDIHLLKGIPMGAGLGGGSADGAFTLRMLNNLFKLNLEREKLEAYALELGSDCPFFISNESHVATGRGEQFVTKGADLSGYFLAIINPGIHVSTKEAFDGIVPASHKNSIETLIANPIHTWKDQLVNDFEQTIFPKHPEVEQLKNEMYDKGALYASMTGTGSTVYGIFEEKPSADCKILEL